MVALTQLRATKTRSKMPRSHFSPKRRLVPYANTSFDLLWPSQYLALFPINGLQQPKARAAAAVGATTSPPLLQQHHHPTHVLCPYCPFLSTSPQNWLTSFSLTKSHLQPWPSSAGDLWGGSNPQHQTGFQVGLSNLSHLANNQPDIGGCGKYAISFKKCYQA